MNDAELRQTITVAREEMGNMLRDVMWPIRETIALSWITHEDEAERRAKAFIRFYKELLAADIDKTTALQMTQNIFAPPADLSSIIREYMLKNQDTVKEVITHIIDVQMGKQSGDNQAPK
jgi:hypothetical protein